MKKYLSIITATFITANAAGFINPLPMADRSVDFGGTKTAIDAYSDGIGARVYDSVAPVDNSAMNTLVFKYGEAAASNSAKISDYVISVDSSTVDKTLANKLKGTMDTTTIPTNPDGTKCDDYNAQTINDVYTNGVCLGVNVEGQSCDDKNSLTYGDVYHNGICAGYTNGTACDDGNSATYNDKYTNGVCVGVANGTACDDSNVQTINDVYTNGVCAGKLTATPTCSDGTYTWNTTNKDCEKTTTVSTPATSQTTGYTVTGSSVSSTYSTNGILKNGNTFAVSYGTAVSNYVSLKADGTLSADAIGTYNGTNFGLKNNGSGGFYWFTGTNNGASITLSGTSVSGNSTSPNANFGIIKINSSSFYFIYGGYAGGTISWSPITTLTNCPTGYTLSGNTCYSTTTLTANGVCNTGYTYNSSLGKCLQN